MSIKKDNNNILENGGDGEKPHVDSRKNNKKNIFTMLEGLSRTDINVQELRNMTKEFYYNDDENSRLNQLLKSDNKKVVYVDNKRLP